MTEPVTFTVHGTPAPQGSKTAGTTKRGHAYVRDDNPALAPWRNAVTAAATQAMNGQPPNGGQLELDVTFVLPRPKNHYRTGRHAGTLKTAAPGYCSTRPDLDKLLRAIGDALTGVALIDDSQIVQLVARKHYGTPAAHITIRQLEP